MNDRYEEIEHTADWALHVYGEDLEQLFRNAAFGMLALMGVSAAGRDRQELTLELDAPDRESLLVSFLEEILFQLEARGLTAVQISFQNLTPEHVKAQLSCLPMDGIQKEIKAVTYHNLAIQNSGEGLETVIVFDV